MAQCVRDGEPHHHCLSGCASGGSGLCAVCEGAVTHCPHRVGQDTVAVAAAGSGSAGGGRVYPQLHWAELQQGCGDNGNGEHQSAFPQQQCSPVFPPVHPCYQADPAAAAPVQPAAVSAAHAHGELAGGLSPAAPALASHTSPCLHAKDHTDTGVNV